MNMCNIDTHVRGPPRALWCTSGGERQVDVRWLSGVHHEQYGLQITWVGQRREGVGAGVTGVKVDCQAGVGLVGSTLGGGPFVAAHYQTALEDSIALHFPGNHAINCMCHSTENIYRCAHAEGL